MFISEYIVEMQTNDWLPVTVSGTGLVQRLTGSRTLIHVAVCDAVAEQNLVQVVDDLWRTDLQLFLDLRQGHFQGRPAALVVLLLQLLNRPICPSAEGAN